MPASWSRCRSCTMTIILVTLFCTVVLMWILPQISGRYAEFRSNGTKEIIIDRSQ